MRPTYASEVFGHTTSASSQPYVIEDPGIVSPLGFHLHVEVEVHAGAEESFELRARGGADLLDHGARLSDDDRLLRFAIHEDGTEQAHDRVLARLLEPIDDDGR